MDAAAVDRGFAFLVDNSEKNGAELRQLCAAVRQALEVDTAGNVLFPAIEKDLIGKGGYAFHWSDVADIGSIAEDLLSEVAKGELFPNQLATVIVPLLKFWQRLRKVRVELTENEFKVIQAVKRRHGDAFAISKFTGLSIEIVNDIVASLKNRLYQDRSQLLEVGDRGQLITQF